MEKGKRKKDKREIFFFLLLLLFPVVEQWGEDRFREKSSVITYILEVITLINSSNSVCNWLASSTLDSNGDSKAGDNEPCKVCNIFCFSLLLASSWAIKNERSMVVGGLGDVYFLISSCRITDVAAVLIVSFLS